MSRVGPPKLRIVTTSRFVNIILKEAQRIFSQFDIRVKMRIIEADYRSSNPDDPILELTLGWVASSAVGQGVRLLVDWVKGRRKETKGFGHVQYKTIEVARSEAMYDLEKVNHVKNFEVFEMKCIKGSYQIVLQEKDTGRKHQYVITKTCNVKSYEVIPKQ